jgi:hypothetical protein
MPTIEESLKLDLHRLIKGGTIVPGARSVGKWASPTRTS